MTEQERLELEAAAFRALVQHLRSRPDVQNIELMNLAGFCRNCLSKWYKAAADDLGIKHVAAWALTSDGRIVGMVPAGSSHLPSLQAVDREAGRFKHKDTLTAAEREALDRSH